MHDIMHDITNRSQVTSSHDVRLIESVMSSAGTLTWGLMRGGGGSECHRLN